MDLSSILETHIDYRRLILVRFDELAFAEKMHDTQGFIEGYRLTELRIYAKWLKYKRLESLGKTYDDELSGKELDEIEKYVEKELIEFCERAYGAFNYVTHYTDIDNAVAYTRLHKLKLPYPLPITEKEWETINSIETDNLRRIAFVMLVDAKYFRYFNSSLTKKYEVNDDTVFYRQMERPEIFKHAKAKFATKEEKMFCFYELRQLGLIDITTGRAKATYLKYVDIDPDAKIVGYVEDYAHLNLEYEKFSGERIGKCQICGSLFRLGKAKHASYCYKHRGYNKIGLRFAKCVDCGKEFSVVATNQKKVRCDECQEKWRKEYKHSKYLSKKEN